MGQVAPKADLNQKNSFLFPLLEKGIDLVSGLGNQFEHSVRLISNLKDRLGEGRLHLAVLGQFKRGKSTLLNALVGEAVLPVSVVPLTAVPTFIRFGITPMIRVHFAAQQKVEEYTDASKDKRTAFLIRYVTEQGNPKNALGVKEVDVLLPSPLLSRGVVLIDTPGIGSTYRHNTQAALNFLEQCDAALFLISADPPITEVELEFLKKIRQKVPRLFFVLNKMDYLDETERKEALSFFQTILAEHLNANENIPIFCISARQGLEARLKDRRQLWAQSGVAGLQAHLIDFLTGEKFAALTNAVSRRAEDCIEAVLMEAGIAVEALKLPQEVLEEKIALFEKSLKQAASERRLIQDVLEGDKKRVAAFLEEQARDLRRESERFLKDIMNRRSGRQAHGKSTKVDIQEAWAEAIPEFFEHQQAALNERVKARLLECLSPHEQRLSQLVETLRHTAADLFQVPYRPFLQEEALEIKKKPYWVLNTWITDPLPILKSMDQRMDELVRRNVENLRWSALQNINNSFSRFTGRIRQRLDETAAATKGAMEEAKVRRSDHTESVASEAARLGDHIAALQKLKADFAAFRPGLSHTADPPNSRPHPDLAIGA
jgi:small GTP-binding protein